MKSIIAIAAILVAGGVGYAMWPAAPQTAASDTVVSMENEALADELLPETLSQNAEIGQLGFEAKCAACHDWSTSFTSQATMVMRHSNVP